ncbi:hypothetical protein CCP3SC15_380033 [Gammaproteobacteria bacterium]
MEKNQKVYVAERAISFYCPKKGPNGLKIPIMNDYGNPKPGEFEEHYLKFTPFEVKKYDGEQVKTFIFIVDEKTAPEVAKYVEEKIHGEGLCMLQDEHTKVRNPEKAFALAELEKVKSENETLRAENGTLATVQQELEELKAKFAGGKPEKEKKNTKG